ncbi:MAG: Na+/H+ antiporter [Pseudopedobacter saltans]|uniref:Na+/H+ antiporter n=1 Tax=Pseudopedobacter saltans TaxID=151895 RepID=A0A2W5ETI9_9SPHI|nr:MAG: Na+/H+ antiporter [Pseudopedobacter saltans]
MPNLGWALGFLLGGIISPPDAVAATSVLSGLKVPRRVQSILEGESLINDASSLVVFNFARAAILTGQFSFWKASLSFFWIAGMGILVGLFIAYLVYLVLRFLPTTPSIDTTVTFIFPYLAYLTAEHFDFSGVLAVVFGGLFLNSRSRTILTYNSRLQMSSVWDMMVYLLNGIVFMLIGLQLPDIVNGLGQYSLKEAILYGLVISLVAIVVRFLWVFPITITIELLRNKFNKKLIKAYSQQWKSSFIIAWSGMRGVVSLASALAVPYFLANQEEFPHRNLILFITFVVILITLVFQGLLLPLIIKKLNIEDKENKSAIVTSMEVQIARQVVDFLNEHYAKETEEIPNFKRVKDAYLQILEDNEEEPVVSEAALRHSYLTQFNKMMLEVIEIKRNALNKFLREDTYPESTIRSKEYQIDLDEARLRRLPK